MLETGVSGERPEGEHGEPWVRRSGLPRSTHLGQPSR